MITVEKYRCEFCNTEYKLKASAEECERNHVTPVKIKESFYLPYNNDKSGLPKSINVQFANGKTIKYVRG